MNGRAGVALKIVSILVCSLVAAAGAVAVLVPKGTKDVEARKVPTADELHLNVNQNGYSRVDGGRIGDVLKLPRGHHVKIVFHYAYPPESIAQPDGYPVHQFTILAPKTESKEEFRLQSKPLSPENRQTEMEFDVGTDGRDKYLLYCDINCHAMAQLFKEIQVVETAERLTS